MSNRVGDCGKDGCQLNHSVNTINEYIFGDDNSGAINQAVGRCPVNRMMVDSDGQLWTRYNNSLTRYLCDLSRKDNNCVPGNDTIPPLLQAYSIRDDRLIVLTQDGTIGRWDRKLNEIVYSTTLPHIKMIGDDNVVLATNGDVYQFKDSQWELATNGDVYQFKDSQWDQTSLTGVKIVHQWFNGLNYIFHNGKIKNRHMKRKINSQVLVYNHNVIIFEDGSVIIEDQVILRLIPNPLTIMDAVRINTRYLILINHDGTVAIATYRDGHYESTMIELPVILTRFLTIEGRFLVEDSEGKVYSYQLDVNYKLVLSRYNIPYRLMNILSLSSRMIKSSNNIIRIDDD